MNDNYRICINILELEALTPFPGLNSRFMFSIPFYSLHLTCLLFQSSGLAKLLYLSLCIDSVSQLCVIRNYVQPHQKVFSAIFCGKVVNEKSNSSCSQE